MGRTEVKSVRPHGREKEHDGTGRSNRFMSVGRLRLEDSAVDDARGSKKKNPTRALIELFWCDEFHVKWLALIHLRDEDEAEETNVTTQKRCPDSEAAFEDRWLDSVTQHQVKKLSRPDLDPKSASWRRLLYVTAVDHDLGTKTVNDVKPIRALPDSKFLSRIRFGCPNYLSIERRFTGLFRFVNDVRRDAQSDGDTTE
ncbi:hypothetical protein F2P81_012448 [Scophthalmus maximus]|uniref:Uncharacterized protein n=1 Tax=Scophthalmus maximus TaxID=52904 RepID=A0A6A4SS51_SCOMX|nr:hypothetical protein F2P81_012448 [Scophthalmus maximus]